jgi:hypothetical protein
LSPKVPPKPPELPLGLLGTSSYMHAVIDLAAPAPCSFGSARTPAFVGLLTSMVPSTST